jgi:putative nucleotidyltransferase with HDIG domain
MQGLPRECYRQLAVCLLDARSGVKNLLETAETVAMAADGHTVSVIPEGITPAPGIQAFRALTAIVVATAVATTVLTAWLSPIRLDTLGVLALLGGFLLFSDLSKQGVYADASSSPGSVAVLAAGALTGLPAVMLLELVASIVGDASRHRLRLETAYNSAVYGLSGVAGGAVLLTAHNHGANGFLLLGVGVIAGLVYYAVNTALVALGMAVYDGRRITSVFREHFAWLAPHHAVYGVLAAGLVLAEHSLGLLGIIVFAMPAAAMFVATGQYLHATEGMVEEMRTKNQTLEALLAENRGLLASLSRGHLQLIRGLAQAIDAKDPYTAGHTSRVAQYSVRIAAALGLDDATRREIEHGALLHDIGKIGVPDAVLTKPGPLDDEEWDAMRRHPLVAVAILDGVELSPTVLSMVRSHHENLDGTGYPDHLVAEELSLPARIARVADAFDAMTSDRPYRDALSLTVARAELRRNVGTQFCGEIVDAFEDLIERGQLDRVLGQREPGMRDRKAS